MKKPKNNFVTRSITAVLFGPVLIGAIAIHSYTYLALFLAIIVLGMSEFYSLTQKENARPQKTAGIIGGVSLFIAGFAYRCGFVGFEIFSLILPLFFSLFVIELYRKKEKPFTNIAYTLLGIFYVALPVTLTTAFIISPLGRTGFDFRILLGFFLLIWANDTGAFVVGSLIGKRKLFERISPKKSWEGSIGGVVFCLASAYAISIFFDIISPAEWSILGGIIAVAANFGDLAESLFKRSIGVKDSGNILPGHGGMLDRFDSAFFAAPFVFAYLELIN